MEDATSSITDIVRSAFGGSRLDDESAKDDMINSMETSLDKMRAALEVRAGIWNTMTLESSAKYTTMTPDVTLALNSMPSNPLSMEALMTRSAELIDHNGFETIEHHEDLVEDEEDRDTTLPMGDYVDYDRDDDYEARVTFTPDDSNFSLFGGGDNDEDGCIDG